MTRDIKTCNPKREKAFFIGKAHLEREQIGNNTDAAIVDRMDLESRNGKKNNEFQSKAIFIRIAQIMQL